MRYSTASLENNGEFFCSVLHARLVSISNLFYYFTDNTITTSKKLRKLLN